MRDMKLEKIILKKEFLVKMIKHDYLWFDENIPNIDISYISNEFRKA